MTNPLGTRTLQGWYTTPLGQLLAEVERAMLDRYLDRLAASTLLQIGGFGNGTRVLRAHTSRQWLLESENTPGADCVGEPDRLPFQSDTMDIVVVVHALEFNEHPHRVLREAERVLAPEGSLLILTFNPFSLWGVAHAWPGSKTRGAPWGGRYFSTMRIRDWLKLLELDVESVDYGFFRPPVGHQRLQQRLQILDQWAPRCVPWLGGVHLTLAKKHIIGVTPMRSAWRPKRRLVAGGLAQPTSRKGIDAICR